MSASASQRRIARFFAAAIAILGWYGLALQFYIARLTAAGAGTPATTWAINYFSYFTIQTNLLVAIFFTLAAGTASSKLRNFATRPTVQCALAVYIAIVGIVYALVLRDLWNPEGMHKIADVILHEAIPLLYLLYWFVFARKDKNSLSFSDVPRWLGFPAFYLTYTLVRGSITGFYPYPFIDVRTIGYPGAFLNATILVVVFLGLGLLLVAIGHRIAGNKSA
jgi:uncharacterized membrane protein YhdT